MSKRGAQAELSFGPAFRVSGKVYVPMDVPGEVCSWKVHAHTRRGSEVPAQIQRDEHGLSFLIVLVLRVAQRVRMQGFDASGKMVVSCTHVVQPLRAKLSSVTNSIMHRKNAEAQRRVVRFLSTGGARFFDADVTLLEKEKNLLRVTLELQGTYKQLEAAHIEMRVVRADGSLLGPGDAIVLGDCMRELEGCPGAAVRRVRYALRISARDLSINLWARFSGATFPDLFEAIDPYDLRDLRIDYGIQSIPAEVAGNYQDWFLSQRVTEAVLAAQREEQEGLAYRPLFSVVIPLYHTPLSFLSDVMTCLLEQSYPKLEIVLVNSTPQDEELAACVREYELGDPRVRVVTLEENLGITENTNAGIEVACGEFVSFMDHDDLIERDLFYWYAREVNKHPDADLLYCDEDLFVEGVFTNPFFKPDWSMAFLESNNYVCHLLTVRRSCLSEIPTPTREFDGAQDHNMALLVGERAREVRHVRRMLYHWRSHPLSTAQNADEKPESYVAGKIAIDRHLARVGFEGEVESIPAWPHCYRTKSTATTHPKVSVICWGEGRQHVDVPYDGELEVLEAWLGEGETWAKAIRREMERATGDLVMLLSRDVARVTSAMLNTLASYALRSDVGLVAPRLLYQDESIMSLGMFCCEGGQLLHMGHMLHANTSYGRGYARLLHNALAVDPSCLIATRSLFNALLWDEEMGVHAACVAACLDAWQHGEPVVVVAEESAYVMCDMRRLGLETREEGRRHALERAELLRRWPSLLERDPFYSSRFSDDGRFGFDGSWKWRVPLKTLDRIRYKLVY